MHCLQEDGPTVVVRSVVKHGPTANSARPPLPGDTLVKVDGYDVRGLGLSQLRPWLIGDAGSVVTLSFEGTNVRYDTSVVRALNGPVQSNGDATANRSEFTITYETGCLDQDEIDDYRTALAGPVSSE